MFKTPPGQMIRSCTTGDLDNDVNNDPNNTVLPNETQNEPPPADNSDNQSSETAKHDDLLTLTATKGDNTPILPQFLLPIDRETLSPMSDSSLRAGLLSANNRLNVACLPTFSRAIVK